jgi:superfamily II DNA or RNA helicase
MIVIPQKKGFYRPGFGGNSRPSGKPVILYEHGENNTLRVPYFYSRKLFGLDPRNNIKPYSDYSFIGELRDYQQVVAKKAIDKLNENGTAVLNLYTAFGKTVTACYLSSLINMKALVIAPLSVLPGQWVKSYRKFSNANVITIEDLENCTSYESLEFDVLVVFYTHMERVPSVIFDMIGVLIIDECHMFCTASRAPLLLKVNPNYIIACSATYSRPDDGMHKVMDTFCGLDRIIRVSTKPFNVIKYMTGIRKTVETTFDGIPKWADFLSDLCRDEQRNTQIIDMIMSNLRFKILVMTRRVEHVEILYGSLKQLGVSVDYMAGSKKKTYNDSNVLIGTTDKLGTGFDEEAACEDYNGTRIDLLIIVVSIKSQGLLEQVAGRCFRSEFPQIIHFVDDEDRGITERHWTESSQPWYTSRNGKIYVYKSPLCLENEEMDKKINTAEESQLDHMISNVATTSEMSADKIDALRDKIFGSS